MTKDRPLHQVLGSHAEGGAVSCSISLSFATCSNGLVHAAGFLFLRYSCSFKWTLNACHMALQQIYTLRATQLQTVGKMQMASSDADGFKMPRSAYPALICDSAFLNLGTLRRRRLRRFVSCFCHPYTHGACSQPLHHHSTLLSGASQRTTQ
jgi:hypothetical protein